MLRWKKQDHEYYLCFSGKEEIASVIQLESTKEWGFQILDRETTQGTRLTLKEAKSAAEAAFTAWLQSANIVTATNMQKMHNAVLAEREACALIAEGFEQTREWVPGSLYEKIRREVAAKIRRRSEIANGVMSESAMLAPTDKGGVTLKDGAP